VVDVTDCPSEHSFANKLARALWGIVWMTLFRASPKICHSWRRFLLRLFGAQIARTAYVYPSCRIWAPWNLKMGDYSCLSHHVDCYCVNEVRIGAHATVSQYSYLCTASHDESDPGMKLITAPITIADQAWISADVFVGPGVTVGEGTVVGARSSVFKSLPPWQICYGSPARAVRQRILRNSAHEGPS
jgi:putative colanic acid biosynthesis acetyltransferase WcaF